MIEQGQFFEFVVEINKINAEEKEESKLWDVWLHKIFDKSYSDWKNSLPIENEAQESFDANATIKNSINILNGFNPE